ncbi:MAG: glycogen debranching enzyme family protein [Nitrospira sp.]|nr:glycogen debranching enzyme family protein [Nitrospira sp.]MBS0166797.1 glycogen debranching enzyme family protein [Nitrospira sp.]MBX3326517.1 glycogen debranching enzyme family protein [Nitrospira sp.]
MRIRKKECHDSDRALSLEWLETNGCGGFASGTVAGANTRRYHGLLVVASPPEYHRYVLVNHLEEWLHLDGCAVSISTNLYPGVIHPQGYRHCVSFSSTPWPTWIFTFNDQEVSREIFCVWGQSTVVVRWKLLTPTTDAIELRVRPKLTGRDYHALHHENGGLSDVAVITEKRVTWQPYHSLPAVHCLHTGTYHHAPDWYRQVQLPLEQERGLDFLEDWWSPGELQFDLEPGREQILVLTSELVDGIQPGELIRTERASRMRRRTVTKRPDRFAEALRQAAGTFFVRQGSRQTVIAGYPWFTDWGRDTFISLPGLFLVTGRYEAAWHVIESFIPFVSEGMVPNRFPDLGQDPEYNTIDASLWFIHTVDRYLVYSKDRKRVRAVAWPAIKQILDGYRQGTRYNIKMDVDGLIAGGMPGTQLTWMDAKIGEWVVTPRYGKPVEIQALWIRALQVGSQLAAKFGERDYAADCRRDRTRAVRSFRQRFWYEDGQYLYDVIDGPEGDDTSMRPNQVYAMSLCDDLLTNEQATQTLRVVKAHLLTSVGLRTLSPQDRRYRPRYEGGPRERDCAYHQGTVWPFLLGPFVTAWVSTFGRTTKSKREARSFLNGIEASLRDTCLGHVSEIFDGDDPHAPRGCPAQAWSLAEPLRAMVEDLGLLPITPEATNAVRHKRSATQQR